MSYITSPSKSFTGDVTPFDGSSPFSRILVSPGRSPLKGNLTGIARKVKDSCADWYNYENKWKTLNAKGAILVNDIANIKLQAILSSQANEDSDDVNILPDELHSLTERLSKVLSDMSRVVDKLKQVTETLKGVADLEWYQQNESFCQEPLFQTWTTDMFYNTSARLLEMYEKELLVKQKVVENVAHAHQRDVIMFFSACWLHEPYIDDDATLLLASMVKETGLT